MNFILIGLGVIIALSFGSSDFLSKGVMSKISAYKTTVYILLMSSVVTLLPALVLTSSYSVSLLSLSLLVFIAVTTFLSFVFLYRAYARGLLSLTAPIVNSYPAWSVVLSVLLIGASFSVAAIFALGVVIVGTALVSTSFSDLKRRASTRNVLGPGIGSAILAATFFGASWTAFGYATQSLGYLLPTVAVRLGATIVGVGIALALKKDIKPVFSGTLPRLALMSVLESIGVILFSLGAIISSTPDAVPILATFGGMSAAFTVCFAIAFLHERLELNHAVGVVVLIAGVVLLLYLTG
jgi:drug/metabolite transporter (DMT)-like permease